MAVTGLGLCGFLVVHLAGNLLLFRGAESYNEYAHALHHQAGLLLVAEIGLLVLFLGHLYLALRTNRENAAARPVGYAMHASKIEGGQGPLAAPASSIMYITGWIVLAFLLLHLADFRFELRNRGPSDEDPFTKAARLLTDPLTCSVYLAGSLVLGYHLLHGFQSAFQSLGLNHPKYTPFIRKLSVVFAIVVAVGFASFPLWALMRK